MMSPMYFRQDWFRMITNPPANHFLAKIDLVSLSSFPFCLRISFHIFHFPSYLIFNIYLSNIFWDHIQMWKNTPCYLILFVTRTEILGQSGGQCSTLLMQIAAAVSLHLLRQLNACTCPEHTHWCFLTFLVFSIY